MPSDISNALGTERQFTPQPDGAYQGRYAGLQVGASSVREDNFTDLANSMSQLDEALQGYFVSKEKRDNELGLELATRMVNSETPEDIKRLNVIDAAQQYGYLDSVDNKYFKAYAAQLRGGFLASRMKQDYDEKYAMSPAKSIDDEHQRYEEFSRSWKDNFQNTYGTPINTVAFEKGYNETNLVNANNLANEFMKKEHEEDISVLMASTKSKLGDLLKNSSALLKTNGAFTTAAQSVFNDVRLMGLPAAYRIKLVDDWTQEAIRSGHFSGKGAMTRFEQMLDSVTLQTDVDGTRTRLSDVLDMQTLRTQKAELDKGFLTQDKLDWVAKFRKAKDLKGAFADIERMKNEEPDKWQEFASLVPQLKSYIDQDERDAKRAKLAQAKTLGKTIANTSRFKHAMGAWKLGHEVSDGEIAACATGIDDAQLQSLFLEEINYTLKDNSDPDLTPAGRAQLLHKVLTFPPCNKLRKGFMDTYVSNLHSLVPQGDGSVPQSDTAKTLVAMYKAAPQTFTDACGGEITSLVSSISALSDSHGGDIDEGIKSFAVYNSLDENTKSTYRSGAERALFGSTIEGMHRLGGGTSNPVISNNPQLYEAGLLQTTVMMAGNNGNPTDAAGTTLNHLRDNYTEYQGTVFPKGCYSNIGCADQDEQFFYTAMNDYVADYAASHNMREEEVDVRYDSRTQMFFFGDRDVSLYNVRLQAKRFYNKAVEDAKNAQPQNDSGTTDSYNGERQEYNPENYMESTGDHSFVSGLTGSSN